MAEPIKVTVQHDDDTYVAESPVPDGCNVCIIINIQLTTAPNTTQIASGACRDSAAGSNAAIGSSNTLQQQSVGGQGTADNNGQGGEQREPRLTDEHEDDERPIVVLNVQSNRTPHSESNQKPQPVAAAATQIASGGTDSAAGTNSAVGSSNTKQQHAVGGDETGSATNEGQNADQSEE